MVEIFVMVVCIFLLGVMVGAPSSKSGWGNGEYAGVVVWLLTLYLHPVWALVVLLCAVVVLWALWPSNTHHHQA